MAGSFRVKGNTFNKRHFRDLGDAEIKTTRAIRQTWFALGEDLKDRSRAEILRKPKSGQTYFLRLRGRRVRHVASAPGETHANFTGELRKSIGYKIHGNNEMSFGYGITRDAPDYAEFVEFGTRRMAARPSLENAINYTQGNVQRHFTSEMNQEFGP